MLTAAGAMASAAAYPCYFEPRWLEVTEKRVRLARRPPDAPVRILHLSDLHASFVVPWSLIHNAITLGLERRPDLICVTGDFITHREEFDDQTYVRALRRLTSAAPTFAVLGNHDGGIWAGERRGYADHLLVERLLGQSGVRLLHNRFETVASRGTELDLVGVGDLWSEEIAARKAFSGVGQRPVVLLAHNPDSKDVLGPFDWDLMLSGHTHGGQVIIPFQGPRYAPVADMRYVAGLKPWGERQIHVTRGVGNLGGVRFRCRPEVSLLVLSGPA